MVAVVDVARSGEGEKESANEEVQEVHEIVENDQSTANRLFSIWKKNTPCLYDLILTQSLDWPSLTVEFFKDIQEEEGFNKHRLLLGTNTSQSEQEQLMICSLKLPNQVDNIEYNPSTGEYGGYKGLSSSVGKINVDIRINHDMEVNKARIMPQNQNIIATKSPSSNLYIFDLTKHPSNPINQSKEINAQICLKGHSKEGFGLSWNLQNEGHLISGSDDCIICLWDISATSSMKDPANSSILNLSPKSVFTFHSSDIEDVQWHNQNPYVFGSTSDDRSFALWDVRVPNRPQIIKPNAHTDNVNCISFHPNSENFFLTGSSDCTIKLWDRRNVQKDLLNIDDSDSAKINEPLAKNTKNYDSQEHLNNALHTFEFHKNEIFSLQWCPHNDTLFASGSVDRSVKIWDLSQIGMEQTTQDAEDGPPELIFVHGGHTEKIADISWHPSNPYMIASVAEDNIVHVWKMTSSLLD